MTACSATCHWPTSSSASTARCVCTAPATRSGSQPRSPRCRRSCATFDRPASWAFRGYGRRWRRRSTSTIDALPSSRRRLARWAIAAGEQAVDRDQRGEAATARAAVAPPRRGSPRARARIRDETGLDQAHTLITGAAPISPQVLRFFHALGLEVLEGYGMSENMTVTTVNRRGHARLGTVGQVVPGCRAAHRR